MSYTETSTATATASARTARTTTTCWRPTALLLDFGTYNAFAAEYPLAAAVSSPPYLTDIANEYAWKFGGQYRFPFGLAVDAIYEHMFPQSAGRA